MATILEKPCDGAAAVARGVSRLFLRNQIMVQSEATLRNHRRADLMGINDKGEIIIVEIKCSRADLLGDQKWPEYLDYCDRFFWAVDADFPTGLLPEDTGLILADAYGAEILRMGAETPLAAARRKVLVQKFARHAALRLQGLRDPMA